MLPDTSNKLLLSWSGPYRVLERRNRVNYLINEKGKSKLYHANLLKKYHPRAVVGLAHVLDEPRALDIPPQSDPFFICQN